MPKKLVKPSAGEHKDTYTMRIDLTESSSFPGVFEPVRPRDEGIGDEVSTPWEPDNTLFIELLECIYDAVLITKRNGRIIKANDRAVDFFDYSPEEFCGMNIINLIRGADTGTLEWILGNLADSRRVFIEAECSGRDGKIFPADITANNAAFSAAGEICFFIRNISVRKQTEEALRRAQEELVNAAHHAGMAEIVTGVLHDVGNIMNSVNVSCDLIRALLGSPAMRGVRKVDEILQAQAADLPAYLATEGPGQKFPQLLSLVTRQLLDEHRRVDDETANLQQKITMIKEVIMTQQDYSRFGGLYTSDVRLSELIENALAIQKASLIANAVRVEKSYEDLFPVKMQKTKAIYILVNLIKNAVQAMQENPADQRLLQIRATQDDDGSVVTVTDHGVGIAPENLTRIFGHGFTTKAEGFGFGLHTSANFMSEMGGHISAHSQGPGRGATFTLVFPPELTHRPGERGDQ